MEKKTVNIVQDPEPLHNLVFRWLHQTKLEDAWKQQTVFSSWEQIVDERLRKHTRPSRLIGKSLEVVVDSSPFYFELKSFRHKELLHKLQKSNRYLEISDISFVFYNSFRQKIPEF